MDTAPHNGQSGRGFEAVDRLYEEADLGVSAETVLKALEPLIERRLGVLLDQFAQSSPELGALLDLRAKITETWRIRRELRHAKLKGSKAMEALQSILDVNVRKPDKNIPKE